MEINEVGSTHPAAPATGQAGLRSEDRTDLFMELFQRYAKAADGKAAATPPSVGELRVLIAEDGSRIIDRTRFMPPPAPPATGPTANSPEAIARMRADVIASAVEAAATAASADERRFEEQQLERTLARLDGLLPPASPMEVAFVNGRRDAFRAPGGHRWLFSDPAQ